ncbi:MAG: hypothetical protein ACOY3H_07765 [Bacillota bacterium]
MRGVFSGDLPGSPVFEAVELIRTLEGRYLVHLTFEVVRVQEPDFAKGCLAIDTNPDGVALCNVSTSGKRDDPWGQGLLEAAGGHNWLAPCEQEEYNSVWPDLKLLALSVR